MSPEKLAILLSEQSAGTPPYILVEHELNNRIAQVQARAAERASYVGIVGVVVGVVVTAFLMAWLQKTPSEKSQTNQTAGERNSDSAPKPRTDSIIPAGNTPVVPSIAPVKQTAETQQPTPKK